MEAFTGARHALRFEAIGTQWSIEVPRALSPECAAAIHRRIDQYDRTWSRFRADSLVQRLAQAPGRVTLPPESADLAQRYSQAYRLTDGAVTPLIGDTLTALGYGSELLTAPRAATESPAAWDQGFEWVGGLMRSDRPVCIDVGAAGKGQLVDLVSQVLIAHGYPDHVVDASGDVVHRGGGDRGRATKVALEHPGKPGFAIGAIEIDNQALCSSATNRRRWADVHHVLDGRDGLPTDQIVATWAIADHAIDADILATMLFFEPAARLQSELDFESLTVSASGALDAHGRFLDAIALTQGRSS